MDETLTIRPQRAFIIERSASFEQRKAERRFVAMTGDAEGWVARVRGQRLPRTAGRN